MEKIHALLAQDVDGKAVAALRRGNAVELDWQPLVDGRVWPAFRIRSAQLKFLKSLWAAR
jgi:hypothetical protein